MCELQLELQSAQERASRTENDVNHYESELKKFDKKLKDEETDLQKYQDEQLKVCLFSITPHLLVLTEHSIIVQLIVSHPNVYVGGVNSL